MNPLNIQKMEETALLHMKPKRVFPLSLKNSIEKVNQTQIESDRLTEKLDSGKDVDLHQVMIASQKASMTMQLTLRDTE